MPKQKSVSSYMVRRIRNYLLDLGQDFEKICTSAGIPENAAVFHDPNARLSAENFLKLFFEAEKACEDPNFGLNLGREMARGYSGGSVLMNMMTNCPTTGEALDLFFRYHCLMADALQPYMVIENNLVKMRWETRGSDIHLPGQIVDTLLSFFSGILTVIAEGHMTLYEVRFNYPEPECLKPYEQRFRAPLFFDQPHSEVLFETHFLSQPVPMADTSLLETLETFAQQQIHRIFFADSWAQKVADRLSRRLIQGDAFSLDAVAGELGVSTRSLQEKLKKENTSYRIILDEIRKEMALKYIRHNDVSLCDIAFLLGFSEQSAFNRAFRRWTGHSPKSASLS